MAGSMQLLISTPSTPNFHDQYEQSSSDCSDDYDDESNDSEPYGHLNMVYEEINYSLSKDFARQIFNYNSEDLKLLITP